MPCRTDFNEGHSVEYIEVAKVPREFLYILRLAKMISEMEETPVKTNMEGMRFVTDRLTRELCSLCKIKEPTSPKTIEWYKKHLEFDKSEGR
jgi:hypothetical protein